MRRTTFLVSVFAILLWAGFSSAAVIQRDWKTSGDGLLSYDDVNQREWLDLSASRLDQFPEPRLQNAVAQFGPGGVFEGFSWGKSGDVIGFAQSAGIDPSTHDFAINGSTTTNLINLLGATVKSSATIRSVGLIDETNSFMQGQLGADIFVILSSSTPQAGIFVPSASDFVGQISNGLMLYRAVPEPSAVFLAFAGLCRLLFIRIKPDYCLKVE